MAQPKRPEELGVNFFVVVMVQHLSGRNHVHDSIDVLRRPIELREATPADRHDLLITGSAQATGDDLHVRQFDVEVVGNPHQLSLRKAPKGMPGNKSS